ncbi:MAG: response regulator [Candidatus Hydrogenedentes bacterium]|nr:response regulator [Candidatus Hydrogenedentota bacterium]
MNAPAVVLIVDRDSHIPTLLDSANGDAPQMDIVEVHSGYQALEALNDRRGFDLVVSEIGLPDMSGLELCRTIKDRRTKGHPAVLLIADACHPGNPVELGHDAGAEGVMLRPLEQITLKSWCHTALRMHELERALEEQQALLAKFLETVRPCSRFAHELNNPLQGCMSAADLLSIHYPSDDRIKTYSRQIQESCERMSQLVNTHCRTLKDLLIAPPSPRSS